MPRCIEDRRGAQSCSIRLPASRGRQRGVNLECVCGLCPHDYGDQEEHHELEESGSCQGEIGREDQQFWDELSVNPPSSAPPVTSAVAASAA
ncbi:hypothetical protein E2562_000004 [Oryza meyeriana var. granulata]|uniref:Uncharacterized protein n=1 Tax=Oryza meyeriana var. granulata TaxID=110450 RepID=A0A6G1DA50_9ORYZ|nr:hypothetical protein E2562_000004 [Oryza meyeriana var. granulata]